MENVWCCPCCDWLVSDDEYTSIKCDSDCPGCHVKTLSDFQFHHEWPEREGEAQS
jgi:hypothetical protein